MRSRSLVLLLAFAAIAVAAVAAVTLDRTRRVRISHARLSSRAGAGATSSRATTSSFVSAATRARARALFSAVMRDTDGQRSLMSWRERPAPLSAAHADVEARADTHVPQLASVSAAQLEAERQFFVSGVDTADIDVGSPRFRQLQTLEHALTQAERQALHAQVNAQHDRARTAGALRARVAAVDAAACLILKAELIRWHGVHHAWPTADEAWTQINTDNGARATKPSQADIRALHPIIMYRIGYRGWAKACDATAITIDATAQAIVRHAPTPTVDSFLMGIEEEVITAAADPDPDRVELAESALGAAPRRVPNLKVVGDHDDGPIIELATGPVPVTTAGRLEHRNVVNTWMAQMRAFDGTRAGNNQLPKSLATINDDFNALLSDVNVGAVPAKYHLGATDNSKAWTVRRRTYAGQNYNNIQVNFEVSLCGYYKSQRFDDLTTDADGKQLSKAAFTAAGMWLSKGLPGVTKAELDALPPQQLCEMGGLLQLYISQMMYFQVASRFKHYNEQFKLIPKDDRPAYRPSHWGGSTPKNFFNVMIKTPIHTAIPYLPFPLSDVVHRFYEAFAALSADDRAAEWKKVHDWVMYTLKNGPDGWAKEYSGKISLQKKGWLWGWNDVISDDWFPADGRWLSAGLKVFRNHIVQGVADPKTTNAEVPCINPIPCARAPRAEQWVRHGANDMQVVLIAEARYQTDALNRAMNEDAGGGAVNTQIGLLAAASSHFKAGAGQAPPAPGPVV